MAKRFATAFVALAVLVTVLWFKSILLRPAVILVAFIGLFEIYNALSAKYKVMYIPAVFFTALNFLGLLIAEKFDNAGFAFNMGIILCVFMLFLLTVFAKMVFKHKKYSVPDTFATIVGYVYATLSFSFFYLIAIKGITHEWMVNSNGTFFYLFMVFAVAWGSDMGGYFTGLICGKHKLCPELSPKKTWEGAIGGVIFTVLFGLGITYFYNANGLLNEVGMFWDMTSPIRVVLMIALFVVLSIAAQIGDFVASTFKRYCGIKDYSNLMPGHGGILDRFDSMLFVSPILYMFMCLPF